MCKLVTVLYFIFLTISRVFSDDTLYHYPDPNFMNDLQSQSITGLDFSYAGANQTIATFVVNSNAAAGFQVTFQFEDGGIFKSANSNEIAMTSLTLHRVSGNEALGAQLEPFDQDYNILPFVNHAWGEYTWNPARNYKPQTKTRNYIFQLRASWDSPIRKLYGIYLEHIKATIDTAQ